MHLCVRDSRNLTQAVAAQSTRDPSLSFVLRAVMRCPVCREEAWTYVRVSFFFFFKPFLSRKCRKA